ncbi:hypothetical protein JZ751_013157 [Albula glossodonta]|uniref:Uncharacterized protein n=1 Tax=Albula glossodonta TaxID=121402 RepID=A0A8T2NW90_9TELE|nr:hypothetical protein JZ751_013157 [Albula glossodonta]
MRSLGEGQSLADVCQPMMSSSAHLHSKEDWLHINHAVIQTDRQTPDQHPLQLPNALHFRTGSVCRQAGGRTAAAQLTACRVLQVSTGRQVGPTAPPPVGLLVLWPCTHHTVPSPSRTRPVPYANPTCCLAQPGQVGEGLPMGLVVPPAPTG